MIRGPFIGRDKSLEEIKVVLANLEDDKQNKRCGRLGCDHNLFWHQGLTGGMCLKSGCDCLAFAEVKA